MVAKNLLLVVLLLGIVGCQSGPPPDILKADANALAQRQVQSRRFDTADEVQIMSASVGLLQDLGYTLDDSETKLGMVSGSKVRKTDNKGQKGLAYASMVLGALGGNANSKRDAFTNVEDSQKFRASLITNPDKNKNITTVRITFQRLVWDMNGDLMALETMNDPNMYADFYAKLSKSIFLEAHKI